MANDINTKELERAVELLKKYADYVEKLGNDKKKIDDINSYIEALRKSAKELEKNSSKEKQTSQQYIKNTIELKNAIQSLRNERAKASKDVMAFYNEWIKGSESAMAVVKNLYDEVGTNSKEIAKKEKEKIASKIELLKTNEDLSESQKMELKTLQEQLNTINATEKAEDNRRKKLENYVETINSGVKLSMTIVNDLMKFTPLGSKSKNIKNPIDATTVDAEKTVDQSSVSSPTTDISVSSSSSAPAPGSESSEENITEDQKTENFKINNEERINSAIAYAEAAKEIANELNSFLDDIDAQRMQKKQTEHDEAVAALDEQLNNEEITQEEYNAQKLALDDKLAKDKAKIEREQAIRKKAMAIFQVGIDMAVGIMKAWIDVPVWASIAFTAAIATMGAVQIAAIAAAPLPKARKGGLIKGNSHENGGVIIEAEGGEAILSRDAVAMFPDMVQLMNAAAANDGIQDGGYAARSIMGSGGDGTIRSNSITCDIDYKKLSSAIVENLKEMKIYVAVTDINDGLKQYVQLEDMAKL